MPTVPAAKRSINQGIFAWTIPGTRKKITVRAATHLTFGESRHYQALVKKKDAAASDMLLDIAASAADRDAILALPLVHMQAFAKAWGADAQAALGKS